jgi:tRNA(Ile)-lysidine synthase
VESFDLFDKFSSRIIELSERFGVDHFVVALSGGLDSVVLAELVGRYFGPASDNYSIVHVDHGLNVSSKSWARHCEVIGQSLGKVCEVIELDPTEPRPDGLEAWARNSRYASLEKFVGLGCCLLTAHHNEDQAETILKHALEGAGPYGLKAMSHVRRFCKGYLARPLLEISREEIIDYAESQKLEWVEDPSNADEKFLRNRIRKTVLPALKSAVPNAVSGLVKMAELQGELLHGLNGVIDSHLAHFPIPDYQVDLEVLSRVPDSLYPYIIKRVIAKLGMDNPGQRHISEILKICKASYFASPVVAWADSEVRLFRGRLYFMRKIPPYSLTDFKLTKVPSKLELPGGHFETQITIGKGLSQEKAIGNKSRITFRKGGEICQLPGRSHRHKLKKLFQTWSIPPWERNFVPILEVNQDIVAVGSQYINRNYAAGRAEKGFTIKWDSNLYIGTNAQ